MFDPDYEEWFKTWMNTTEHLVRTQQKREHERFNEEKEREDDKLHTVDAGGQNRTRFDMKLSSMFSVREDDESEFSELKGEKVVEDWSWRGSSCGDSSLGPSLEEFLDYSESERSSCTERSYNSKNLRKKGRLRPLIPSSLPLGTYSTRLAPNKQDSFFGLRSNNVKPNLGGKQTLPEGECCKTSEAKENVEPQSDKCNELMVSYVSESDVSNVNEADITLQGDDASITAEQDIAEAMFSGLQAITSDIMSCVPSWFEECQSNDLLRKPPCLHELTEDLRDMTLQFVEEGPGVLSNGCYSRKRE